jgi:hypothetical protein
MVQELPGEDIKPPLFLAVEATWNLPSRTSKPRVLEDDLADCV